LAKELRRFRAGHPASKQRGAADAVPPLLILIERLTGKKLSVREPVTIIGRAPDCDLVVKANDVSKRHCQILSRDGQFVVEDLSSINGTVVNGKPIQRYELHDGDMIDIA